MVATGKVEIAIEDEELLADLRRRERLLRSKREWDAKYKELKGRVMQRLRTYRDEFGDDTVFYVLEGATVSVTSSDGAARVSAERLLELGVAPEIIEQATNKTPYERLNANVRLDDGGVK